MGKRKQAKPRRNVDAAVSEVARTTPLKRRRRIVNEDDETSVSSFSAEASRKISQTERSEEETGAAPISEHLESAEASPSHQPLNERLDQALDQIFSNVNEAASTRRLQDRVHLKAILDGLYSTKDSQNGSEHILPSILDFDMLCVYICRTLEPRIEDKPISNTSKIKDSKEVLQNIIARHALLIQEGQYCNDSLHVSFCLTGAAFEEASPSSVSTFLLGTNAIRRKNKSLHAALSLRRALAVLFPNTLLEAIDRDPSGRMADPVKARFVYGLVDNVRLKQKCREIDEAVGTVPPITVAGLRPTMRRYQSYAVEWMLSREKNKEADDCIWRTCWLVISPDSSVESLTEYLDSVPKQSPSMHFDRKILVNPFTGWLCRTVEEAKVATVGRNYAGVHGGILAESMGLGKTVEVLACILSNRRPADDVTLGPVPPNLQNNSVTRFFDTSTADCSYDENDVCTICCKDSDRPLGWVHCTECKERIHSDCAGYNSQDTIPTTLQCSSSRCPCCIAKKYSTAPIKSRGTLIVTPPAILEQWAREIRRHTAESLKIVVYPGVKKLCNNTLSIDLEDRQLVHSHVLADADIVLTTFPVLNSELAHSENQFLEAGKSIRRKKRYRVVPSPLNSIEWWRICLDEAQRVEGTAAAAARMAFRLRAKHRWCVSGTPIGRGRLEDLYGLLLFVGVMPFQDKESFRHCLRGSYPGLAQRLKELLYPILWRSTKANPLIREQLDIPEQIETKTFLDFSSIEKHFYKRQLENTILAVNETSNLRKKSEAISSKLHTLRAACCHPQVGSSGIQKLGSKAGNTISNRVLSMQQVLDKLIDDARLQCEESQRIGILHTNALACISRLKVELKQWEYAPFCVEESDHELLRRSASSYLEALELTDRNAKPSEIIGEAELSGCDSFQSPGLIIRDGIASLSWNIDSNDGLGKSVWAKVDFSTGKKLTAFQVRPTMASENSAGAILFPKNCVLQFSLASLGGAFVDVRRFSFAKDPKSFRKWLVFDGIRTNRSKTWRFLIENYHEMEARPQSNRLHIGVEVHFMEPSVGSDDLQRMHILHNAALVVDSLIQAPSDDEADETIGNLGAKLRKVNTELRTLETNYLGSAKANHQASRLNLRNITKRQNKLQTQLRHSSPRRERLWKDTWWQDLLSFLQIEDGDSVSSQVKDHLCGMVRNDLYELFNGPFDVGDSGFPEFGSIFGLRVALKSRKERNYSERTWISKVTSLNENPQEGEILENASCHKCRSDWFQTGPKCRHCKLEEEMNKYEKYFDDRVSATITNCILRWLTDFASRNGSGNGKVSTFILGIREQASLYFNLLESEKKELVAAKRHWRVHFDLLSDYDELNACKSTMRLPRVGENVHLLPKHEIDRIVDPRSIPALVMDHKTKQASALAALRRDTASLRYLKNQSAEHVKKKDQAQEQPTCPVCLMEFNIADRAVLKCGHSLHMKCIDEILKRSGGLSTIRCPMKCLNTTSKNEVMIAAAESVPKDDGSKISTKIEGSWGTKVDRLIADLIAVIHKGERCLVFSQWDDLLSIIESALSANCISFTHPKGAKMFGASAQALRSSCQVMLLNVKRGAEGLTLVAATHVFMIEPLLHCGLDAQAINRVHRIGQTEKTYVHRYIIKDTIEEKIDAIRMERVATFENVEEEDSTFAASKHSQGKIQAGGLDGGFSAEELQEILNTF